MGDTMTSYRIVSMFTCLLLAVRILRYFRFQPRLAVLTKTVAKSLNEFGPFFVVFLIMFLAYIVGGTLFFGQQLEEFRNLFRSAVTCLNILFGDSNFEAITAVDYSIAVGM